MKFFILLISITAYFHSGNSSSGPHSIKLYHVEEEFVPNENLNYENVETLSIRFGKVTNFPKNLLCAYPKLKHLNVVGNKYKGTIDKEFFKCTPKLRKIEIIENPDITIALGAFSDLNLLDELTLDGQNIGTLKKDYFSPESRLIEVHLRDCNIDRIEPDAFQYFDTVKILDLGYNKLSGFGPETFKYMVRLEKLYLHFNQFGNHKGDSKGNLDYNNYVVLDRLTHLDFAANGLTSFDVDKLLQYAPNLKEFNYLSNSYSCSVETEIAAKLKKYNITSLFTNYGKKLSQCPYVDAKLAGSALDSSEKNKEELIKNKKGKSSKSSESSSESKED